MSTAILHKGVAVLSFYYNMWINSINWGIIMEYNHFIIVKYVGWTTHRPSRYSVKTSWPGNYKPAIFSKHVIPDGINAGQDEYAWIAEHFLKERGIADLEIDCGIHSGKDSITYILKKKKAHKKPPVGCMIAQRITSALTGHGIDYAELSKIVYSECMDIGLEQSNGDWIEMPNGDTYTKTFSVNKHLENGERK